MQKISREIDSLQEEINKHRLLSPHLIKQIKEYYRIGLIYTSNALEGNTLTESETKVVLEEGLTVGGRPLKDIFEAIGLSEANDFMHKLVKDKTVTCEHIKELHRIFYYRIDANHAGIYRDVKVFIAGSKYPTSNPADDSEFIKFIAQMLKETQQDYLRLFINS